MENGTEQPIAHLDNVSYIYPRSTGPVLTDINLEIYRGGFLGIIGPTGAGKSTLLLTLSGIVPQFFGGRSHLLPYKCPNGRIGRYSVGEAAVYPVIFIQIALVGHKMHMFRLLIPAGCEYFRVLLELERAVRELRSRIDSSADRDLLTGHFRPHRLDLGNDVLQVLKKYLRRVIFKMDRLVHLETQRDLF